MHTYLEVSFFKFKADSSRLGLIMETLKLVYERNFSKPARLNKDSKESEILQYY